MKVFYVSWNDLETVFPEMPWKKNFTVYPSLKSNYFEEHLLTAASGFLKQLQNSELF